MKILGTGLTGLVGSRVVELLQDTYQFDMVNQDSGFSIVNKEQVFSVIKNTDAEIVLHLAAKANVDLCEKDKLEGKKGEAWLVNVEGTRNIAQACAMYDKKLIYISTGFVFDGSKECYTEEDKPFNAINWYGQTKLEGERIVRKLKTPWLILRLEFPYRAIFERMDFMRAIKNRLEFGHPVKGVIDSYFCPTFMDDMAQALNCVIQQKQIGIFHVVGSELISPFEAALIIAEIFDLDKKLISKTTRAEYFANKAERPFKLFLKNDKIKSMDIDMKSFTQGLQVIKQQLQKA